MLSARIVNVLGASFLLLGAFPSIVSAQAAGDTNGESSIDKLDNSSNPSVISALWAKQIGKADTVILTTAGGYADALSSGALQGKNRAPLFFVGDTLDDITVQTIKDLGATKAIVLGGTKAISTAIEEELSSRTNLTNIARVQGASRVETSVNLALATGLGEGNSVIIARADDWADSIAAGALAAKTGAPVLLVTSPGKIGDKEFTLHPAVADFIKTAGVESVTVVGGTNVVSDSIVAEVEKIVPATKRLKGGSRVETAVQVARAWGETSKAIIVDGYNEKAFYNGFASALVASQLNAPVVLSNGDSIDDETLNLLSSGSGKVAILGSLVNPTVSEKVSQKTGASVRTVDLTTPPEPQNQPSSKAEPSPSDTPKPSPSATPKPSSSATPKPPAGANNNLGGAGGAGGSGSSGGSGIVGGPSLQGGGGGSLGSGGSLSRPSVPTPPAVKKLSLSPAGNTSLGVKTGVNSREYTISNTKNGVQYTIALFDKKRLSKSGGRDVFLNNGGTAITTKLAEQGDVKAKIVSVNGTAVNPGKAIYTVPAQGTNPIRFTVQAEAYEDGNNELIPVVFVDSQNNNALNLDQNGVPEEEYLIGGVITINQDAKAQPSDFGVRDINDMETAAGYQKTRQGLVTVESVDKDNNTLVIKTPGGAYKTVNYDANDLFTIITPSQTNLVQNDFWRAGDRDGTVSAKSGDISRVSLSDSNNIKKHSNQILDIGSAGFTINVGYANAGSKDEHLRIDDRTISGHPNLSDGDVVAWKYKESSNFHNIFASATKDRDGATDLAGFESFLSVGDKLTINTDGTYSPESQSVSKLTLVDITLGAPVLNSGTVTVNDGAVNFNLNPADSSLSPSLDGWQVEVKYTNPQNKDVAFVFDGTTENFENGVVTNSAGPFSDSDGGRTGIQFQLSGLTPNKYYGLAARFVKGAEKGPWTQVGIHSVETTINRSSNTVTAFHYRAPDVILEFAQKVRVVGHPNEKSVWLKGDDCQKISYQNTVARTPAMPLDCSAHNVILVKDTSGAAFDGNAQEGSQYVKLLFDEPFSGNSDGRYTFEIAEDLFETPSDSVAGTARKLPRIRKVYE